MFRGLFVTGTDTGVGKTVACAALMHRFRRQASESSHMPFLRYWKPIQTGIEQDDDTKEVIRLGGCEESEVLDAGVRLPRPVSPHLAAKLSGHRIDLESVAKIAPEADDTVWIVEGAGGVLVPLNDQALMVDLMRRFDLPILIVARSGLGTINHTLMTIEALRRRALSVAAVVMVGERDPENRAAIETYGDVPVVGELPALTPLTTATLKGWARSGLDEQNLLASILGIQDFRI